MKILAKNEKFEKIVSPTIWFLQHVFTREEENIASENASSVVVAIRDRLSFNIHPAVATVIGAEEEGGREPW